MVKELVHPEWVRRLNLFGPAVGDARSMVDLDPDELLRIARASTGLDDTGEAEWPGWEETYERLLTSIDAESQLHVLGRILTRGEVLRVLRTGLRLQEAWTSRSAILAEPVDAPVFVVGPPRSGTTILLELLALDPQLRSPLAWEALAPLPLDDGGGDRGPEADRDRRIELAECEQEFWADIHPDFMTMHELASDLPCECLHFLSLDFASSYWSMLYDTPTFTGWQLEHLDALARVYRLHRRMLQTFQHGGDARTWLLKSPGHLQMLPELFAEYPDARVVHTHRDPRQFIGSLVSVLAVLRFTRSDEVDVAGLGALMEVTYQMFLEKVIDERTDGSVPDDRIVDSHFLDLMADPVAALRKLYDGLALEWPAGHDRVVGDYLAAKPKGKHGRHAYTLADVGLDDAHVRATFAPYVAHYGITEE